MTASQAKARAGAWYGSLPTMAQGLVALVTIGSLIMGGAGVLVWAQRLPATVEQQGRWIAAADSAKLPIRVDTLESKVRRQTPILEFLACSEAERQAGRDPRACRIRYRDPLAELIPHIISEQP